MVASSRSTSPEAKSPEAKLPAAKSWVEGLARLHWFSQIELQPSWRMHEGELAIASTSPEYVPSASHWQDWPTAPLNDRRHIAWAGGKQVLWLGRQFRVPETLFGYEVRDHQIRLDLSWWADSAQIFVNGHRVQTGDLFDCVTKFRLAERAVPDQIFEIAIRLTSPGHDRGALVLSQIRFEAIGQEAIGQEALRFNTGAIEPTASAPLKQPQRHCPEPGFVADELAVLGHYVRAFQPEALGAFEAALVPLHRFWGHPGAEAWASGALPDEGCGTGAFGPEITLIEALGQVRDRLLCFSPWLKQRQISLLGHAHLDMAWLWPVAETWDAAERTFESVLQLQTEFPDLIFGHSSPALYAWLQEHRPELWQRIQDAIATGRWEVIAGLWIEPDCILPSGESLIRQVLYGQRYIEQAFGVKNRVAWLPDSFGFCNQLPQIFKQGGIDYFVTEKLLWNDTTEFPYQLFDWRSPDGTSLTSYMSARIGTQINAVQMAEYACNWEANTGKLESLWLPGVGDHGGGPTREMLETAQRWARSPFFPRIEFTQAHDYLDRITEPDPGTTEPGTTEPRTPTLPPPARRDEPPFVLPEPASHPPKQPITLPVWDQDLYLEFHRGCYTTHADQKRHNRQAEALLYQAELFAALAAIATDTIYPKTAIESLWKKLLFNQFHDILPGSSIPEVFVDANRDWAWVMREGQVLLEEALGAILRSLAKPIAQQIEYPEAFGSEAEAFVVFNPLNWARSGVVAVPASHAGALFDACDHPDQPLATQRTQRGQCLIAIDAVPGIGYQTIELPRRDEPPFVRADADADANTDADADANTDADADANTDANTDASEDERGSSLRRKSLSLSDGVKLENDQLTVVIDSQTGDLASVFSKQLDRELLSGPGNQLQAFRDRGQYWDAWNIDPDYANHPLPPTQLISIEAIEPGPLEWRTRVIRKLGDSVCQHDYVLYQHLDMLYIETQIDWQADHVLLKVAFPLALEASHATYEVPCGSITRTTKPQTEAEKAQWEVPALRWANLTDDSGGWGVSLLNDCKYGYDAQPSLLRLTLLRSSNWPEVGCDKGVQTMTYALYAHAGTVHASQTVQRGYELQMPLLTQPLPKPSTLSMPTKTNTPTLPSQATLFSLGTNSLVLSALKQSEADPNQWIFRCYEASGQQTVLRLSSDLELQLGKRLNGMEEETDVPGSEISPWQIQAFQLLLPDKAIAT